MRLSTLGRLFFAIAMIAFGVQQLITGAFVRLVPPLPAWVPGPSFWACLVGAVLILAGVAIGTERKGLWGAAVVGVLLVLSILFLHIPKALCGPAHGLPVDQPLQGPGDAGRRDRPGGISLPDDGTALAKLFRKLEPLGPLFFSTFLILGGIQHFVYADFVMKLVPAWIPGTRYWVYFTGLALIAGGVGILIPRTSRLASTMVGIMILLWVVLLHIPRALTMHDAGETAAIFEALAMSGIGFLLADRRTARSR